MVSRIGFVLVHTELIDLPAASVPYVGVLILVVALFLWGAIGPFFLSLTQVDNTDELEEGE